jgi:uncharacterized protein (DUF1330 family)
MAAYVIVDVEVVDPEAYREYTQGVPATLALFGGRFLVRGGRMETLEGDWQPQRVVILEFPDIEHAKAWHASPEYAAILPIRQRHARTNFLTVVEGVAPSVDAVI